MLPCPLIVRAHSRLPFGGQPSSTLQRSNVPTFKRSNDSVLLTSLLPYLTIALSSSPDPVGVTARPCSKSFTCNTYSPPRKCCKQKTYGLAKPFRCNTYKKQGGSFSTFRRADEGPIYPPPIFFILQSYLHNGRGSTLLESIRYAHFSSRRRVYPSPLFKNHPGGSILVE